MAVNQKTSPHVRAQTGGVLMHLCDSDNIVAPILVSKFTKIAHKAAAE